MAGKKKAEVSISVSKKARQLLAFAQEQAEQAEDWVALHNALFGIGGKATEVFATESERTAFSKTPECKRIFALMDSLPRPPVKDFPELLATANGKASWNECAPAARSRR